VRSRRLWSDRSCPTWMFDEVRQLLAYNGWANQRVLLHPSGVMAGAASYNSGLQGGPASGAAQTASASRFQVHAKTSRGGTASTTW
jgi:hypothetical protein